MTIRHALLLAATAGLAGCSAGQDGNSAANATGNVAALVERPASARGTLADALGKPGSGRFATAVRSAGMEPVFKGPGPYTLFIPTDAALAGAGELGDKAAQIKLISAHVLPGTILAEDIGHAIDANDGKALLKTMAGDTLTATRDGDRIKLASSGGGSATLAAVDEVYGNGVAHRVDGVLKPGGK